MSAPQVAQFLGDGTRTVEYWVKRFNAEGLSGLVEGERPGRPARLSESQLEHIGVILREPPRAHGMTGNLWDGKTLGSEVERSPVPATLPAVGLPTAQAASTHRPC
jgi:transposase